MQTTITHYDAALRPWRVVQPDNTSVTNTFYPTGLRRKTIGSRVYAEELTYDYAGRRQTLTTWTNATAGTGAALTTWNYNSYRGWLQSKRYHDNTGPDYTYTAAGRLASRAWARTVGGLPLATTYTYNNAGDLGAVDYLDGTPDVSYGYNRLGQQTIVSAGGSTLTRTLNAAGQLLAEAHSRGL